MRKKDEALLLFLLLISHLKILKYDLTNKLSVLGHWVTISIHWVFETIHSYIFLELSASTGLLKKLTMFALRLILHVLITQLCFLAYSYEMIAFSVALLCDTQCEVEEGLFPLVNNNPESVISIACFFVNIYTQCLLSSSLRCHYQVSAKPVSLARSSGPMRTTGLFHNLLHRTKVKVGMH